MAEKPNKVGEAYVEFGADISGLEAGAAKAKQTLHDTANEAKAATSQLDELGTKGAASVEKTTGSLGGLLNAAKAVRQVFTKLLLPAVVAQQIVELIQKFHELANAAETFKDKVADIRAESQKELRGTLRLERMTQEQREEVAIIERFAKLKEQVEKERIEAIDKLNKKQFLYSINLFQDEQNKIQAKARETQQALERDQKATLDSMRRQRDAEKKRKADEEEARGIQESKQRELDSYRSTLDGESRLLFEHNLARDEMDKRIEQARANWQLDLEKQLLKEKEAAHAVYEAKLKELRDKAQQDKNRKAEEELKVEKRKAEEVRRMTEQIADMIRNQSQGFGTESVVQSIQAMERNIVNAIRTSAR
ncbi:MAG: hypothetical protein KF678_03480 [Phycisphaeraceae bacterium]|nr:hypothetical protein [Phycisphaeraceae bacterium]